MHDPSSADRGDGIDRRAFLKLSSGAAIGTVFVAGGLPVARAQGLSTRPWVGPDYWASPLYDWGLDAGDYVARIGRRRMMHSLLHQIENPAKDFKLSVRMRFDSAPAGNGVWAGLFVAANGDGDDYRSAFARRPDTDQFIGAHLRSDGRLSLGDQFTATSFDVTDFVDLTLRWRSSDGTLILTAVQGEHSERLTKTVAPNDMLGNVGLLADSASSTTSHQARFKDFVIAGAGLSTRPEQRFGPIMWTQYTLAGGVLKLTAQMAPVGAGDSDQVELELAGVRYTATIDGRSRTATFRVAGVSGATELPYAVRYDFEGATEEWSGTVRAEPTGDTVSIGLMSCDKGYAFPTTPAVETIATADPDVLYFAGDQIYESYGGFPPIRSPLETSLLDYLYKWYFFGWTWRELLRDRPSFLALDDHDVYQGNLWGAGGIPTADQDLGGFRQSAAWLNAVQRMHTSHLPDPVDPTPVEQGIEVYFTTFTYAGIGWALLEDRKFKSGSSVLPPGFEDQTDPAFFDVPDAVLLGDRQEAMLRAWADDPAPLKVALSQSVFNQAHTHTRHDLYRNDRDLDANGWPQTARDRAVSLLADAGALHLVGDQHLGQLIRYGVNEFDDAGLVYMGTGTVNGWPRAWWPSEEGGNPIPGVPYSGQFIDSWGNPMTVLRTVNPPAGADLSDRQDGLRPYEVADKKVSGVSVITLSKSARTATFDAYRFNVDVEADGPLDSQFPGFPVTLPLPEPTSSPQHQVGQLSVAQPDGDTWTAVTFDGPFAEVPIVVAGPPSQLGVAPLTVRVRDITTVGFEIQVDEWDYDDGVHKAVDVHYLAITPGRHDLGGLAVEAARLDDVDQAFAAYSFAVPFSGAPVVLTQATSAADPSAVTCRLTDVSATGFRLRLQEEEAADGLHGSETVDYVALEVGSGLIDDRPLVVGVTGRTVTHDWHTINFGSALTSPTFLAMTQTTAGTNPFTLRHRRLIGRRVQVRCQEEQSRDTETNHSAKENVGWLAIGD